MPSTFLVVKVLDLSVEQSAFINYAPLDVPPGLVKAGFGSAAPAPMSQALDAAKKPLTGVFETLIPAATTDITVEVSGSGKTITVGSTEYWPVKQKLKLNTTPTPSLAFDTAQEINVRNLDNHTRGADFTVEVYVVLGQLLDITARVSADKRLDLTPHTFNVIHANTPVLKAGGRAPDLFDITLRAATPTGRLRVALRTTTPKLIAVYRPEIFATALYPKQTPVACHLFFHPTQLPWDDPYPDGFNYFEFIQRYMLVRIDTIKGTPVDIGKHMIYSHADAGDKMIFIYPIGGKKELMGDLKSQAAAVRILQEVNYWLQRMDGVPYPLAPVGRLSLSFFSAGARFANALIAGPKNALFFDTLLKEVYSFDGAFEEPVLGPDGKPVLVRGKDGKLHKQFRENKTETKAFCDALKTWFRGGADDRAIRIYNQSRLWFDELQKADPGATTVNGPLNAAEAEGPNSSVLFVPTDRLWKAILPAINGSAVHQLIPDRFMNHALGLSKAVPPTPPPPPGPVPVKIDTTSPLPAAAKDLLYSATLKASGGTPPFTWKVTSGSLPAGLTLSPGGDISGTALIIGDNTFTVQAKDSAGATASATFDLRVVAKCFIIGAAYGSQLAPEVSFLWHLREQVLRDTEWGRNFFARYWKHYYRISPAIAEEMETDPELRDTIRWSIVEPWTNYMKLLLTRPDWDQVDFDALPASLVDFLSPLRENMETWLRNIPLPDRFKDRDPIEAVKELNVALTFVRRTGGMEYLNDLCARGELPLDYGPELRPELVRMLQAAGRTEAEIARILDQHAGPLAQEP